MGRNKNPDSASGAIRKILEETPDLPPAAVRDRLAALGVSVDTHLVKVVRSAWRKERAERLKGALAELVNVGYTLSHYEHRFPGITDCVPEDATARKIADEESANGIDDLADRVFERLTGYACSQYDLRHSLADGTTVKAVLNTEAVTPGSPPPPIRAYVMPEQADPLPDHKPEAEEREDPDPEFTAPTKPLDTRHGHDEVNI